ncbi:MAG: metallophosphoesterase N-terminal domain-containing protein, partial [Chitinophagaceae bacterium]
MQRRKFLRNVALIAGGIFLTRGTPAKALGIDGKPLSGFVRSNGKPIKGVVVSDGYSVVQTDKKGRYSLTPHAEAISIFISIPSGYAFHNESGIVRHYHLLQNVKPAEDINFELQSLGRSDVEHEFIIWADPQVKNAKDVQKMMEES